MGKKTTRRRMIPFPGKVRGGTVWYTTNSSGKTTASGRNSSFLSNYHLLNGTQVTVSENHPEWNSRKRGHNRSDIGGEFFTQVKRVEGAIPLQANTYSKDLGGGSTHHGTYHGPCVAYVPAASGGASGYLPPIDGSESSLRAAGATAIARCKPTNSTADLAVGLGELYREGIPQMLGVQSWKERTLRAKNAGSDYLAFEFGFVPLANEIASVASGVVDSGNLLDQYIAGAGKVTRRGYQFPTSETEINSVHATNVRAVVGGSVSDMLTSSLPTNRVLKSDRITVERWFKGAFTYALPGWFDNSNPVDRQRLLAQKILGLELTPQTVWNLAPWTWAVDWFTNMGDVISNLTDWAVDGLSLRYGYIMEQTTSTRTFILDGPTGYRGSLVATPLTLVTQTKVRKKATPFGFGATWDTLSPKQLAILGALGISRTR